MPPEMKEWQFWAITIPCGGAMLWYWVFVLGRRRW